MTAEHQRWMQHALALSRRNLGQTWPNPSVGALLVKDSRIVGEGWTGRGGRPHAETQAIAQAGELAQGATLYVTLEPCSHYGKTPPCSEAVAAAGITRCVIAVRDPNTLVNGQGIARLKSSGIEIIENVGEAEAREINRGFFSVIEKGRPYVALKLATSQDGKIADADGKSKWITGEASRAWVHLLRSQHDAIATGIGTVLADDPLLTCRLPGLEDRSPVRVVFDHSLHLPAESQLVKTAKDVPVWVVTSAQKTDLPVTLLNADTDTIESALRLLTAQGITRLMVEAGEKLATSFFRSGMVDRIYWFCAPAVIGAGGMDAITGGMDCVLASPDYEKEASRSFGDDILTVYRRCRHTTDFTKPF